MNPGSAAAWSQAWKTGASIAKRLTVTAGDVALPVRMFFGVNSPGREVRGSCDSGEHPHEFEGAKR